MILNGDDIFMAVQRKEIGIDPFDASRIGANSYDVMLYDELLIYDHLVLDSKKSNSHHVVKIPESGYPLQKDKFYLGRTVEKCSNTSGSLVPMIEGRSSWARLGLCVHMTAGFGDVGFCGYWTLELKPSVDLLIYPFQRIAQLYWLRCAETRRRYHGKYQGNVDTVVSRIEEDK